MSDGSGARDSIPFFNFKVMARKKNVEEILANPQGSIEDVQPVATPAPVDAETQTAPVEEVKQEVAEPSEQIKKLLRCYSNYAALYVDSRGGCLSRWHPT